MKTKKRLIIVQLFTKIKHVYIIIKLSKVCGQWVIITLPWLSQIKIQQYFFCNQTTNWAFLAIFKDFHGVI